MNISAFRVGNEPVEGEWENRVASLIFDPTAAFPGLIAEQPKGPGVGRVFRGGGAAAAAPKTN